MKSAVAYLKNDVVYIRGYFLTDTPAPMLREGGDVYIAQLSDFQHVGEQLLDCLAQSMTVRIPSVKNYKEEMRNDLLLKAVGVKNWNMLTKTTNAITVWQEGSDIKLTPQIRTRYTKIGFYFKPSEKSFTPVIHSDEDLGKAVAQAFDLCEENLFLE